MKKLDTTHTHMGLKVSSAQFETPIGANSAQVVSVNQWKLGYCVLSSVHPRMRITMQSGWGYQVIPPVKPCQISNYVPCPLPYETQEPLILLKMQECFAPCFFTALWHNMKSGICSSVTFFVIDIAPGWAAHHRISLTMPVAMLLPWS